ncbi:hypothetical protein BCR32DRAFT_296253 [Anaeromyces robustus]|uniref:HTH cro/C1-type domain-containing protein n=1 Tax=Anaeromyces robustus TaxID=1754192 RepID=A0A1Y1WT24_9FUNG|nr:hypothetical protein BCR32DRAFT_296253 [Anaeromyces robustus]|eukprot:ORX76396.1 hypothetical protein BCR32DRAFT_296253 [Anaeromyces robustus]
MTDVENSISKNIIRYYPKYDTPFKNLFKKEENKNLLIDLLNGIIDGGSNNPIVDVQFLDSEFTAERVKFNKINKWDDLNNNEGKEKIDENLKKEDNNNNKNNKRPSNNIDINKNKKLKQGFFEAKRARLNSFVNGIRKNYSDIIKTKNTENLPVIAITKSNEIINIEIQVHEAENTYKRSLFYTSSVITHSLKKGDSYNDLPKIVMINFLHYNLFKNNNDKFYWNFSLHDKITKTEEGFEGLLNIYFIELSKYEKLEQQEKLNKKYLWYLFMVDPNNQLFCEKETPQKFVQARETLLSLETNVRYCEQCDFEEKLTDRYIKNMEYRENIGIEKGIVIGKEQGIVIGKEQGIEIGREEGAKLTGIKTVFKMFYSNFSIDTINDFMLLDTSEVLEIQKFLNNPNYESLKQLAEKLNIPLEILKNIYKKIFNINL